MTGPAIDELDILRLVARLAQAADDRDEAAYLACLAPRVARDSATPRGFAVSAKLYARNAIARAAAMDWTHHKLLNPVIEIDSDGVHAAATIDVVVDLARTGADRRLQRATIGGRYDLGFIRLAGEWRIERRALRRRYIEGDPGLDLANAAPRPTRDAEDNEGT